MNNKSEYLQKYLDYIDNTGGKVLVEHFDEDWEPIGPLLRKDLHKESLVQIVDGFLVRLP